MATRVPGIERRQAPRLIASRVVAAGVAGVWMLVAARQLEVAAFADLVLAASLAGMAVQAADAGVSIELPRAIVGRREDAGGAVREAMLRRFGWGVGAAIAAAGAYLFAARSGSPLVVVGFGASTVATAVYGAAATGLRAARWYEPEQLIEPGARLFFLAVAVAAVASGGALDEVALAYGLADLTALGAYATVARRLPRLRTAARPRRLRPCSVAHLAVPLAAAAWRVDVWLLARISTGEQVALYGAAYRLLDTSLIPSLVLASMLPGRVLEPRVDVRRLVATWSGAALLSALPFLVAATLFGSELMEFVFGRDFAAGGGVVRTLAVVGFISAAALVATSAVSVLRPSFYLRTVVALAVVGVALDLVLIPRYGAGGAAGATLLTQLGLLAALWWTLTRAEVT